jgi:hypothetical protein
MYDWEYRRDGTGFHTGPVSLSGCSLFPSTTETTHDEDFNRIETRYHDNPAEPLTGRSRFVRKYDWMGRLISDYSYSSTGYLEFQVIYKYNWRNQPLERNTYDAQRNLQYSERTSYNDDGTEKDFVRYNALDGTHHIDYRYQLDGHGNWVKQTAVESTTKYGKLIASPVYAVYRAISYYDER